VNHSVTDTFSTECFATAFEAEPQDYRQFANTIVRWLKQTNTAKSKHSVTSKMRSKLWCSVQKNLLCLILF